MPKVKVKLHKPGGIDTGDIPQMEQEGGDIDIGDAPSVQMHKLKKPIPALPFKPKPKERKLKRRRR